MSEESSRWSTTAPTALDDEYATDVLAREVMAAHLAGLIAQVTSSVYSVSTVFHIDGRWGTGKSTLMRLLERRFDRPKITGKDGRAKPVMVWYDAWRESAIAPEWWSIAAAINRSVRRQRALSTRFAMTVSGLLQRIVRSPSVVVATLLLGLTGFIFYSMASKDFRALGPMMTGLASVATCCVLASRVLFWSSPTFGKMQIRNDDNPLGHIAMLVRALRRWSPRRPQSQRIADTAYSLVLVAAAIWVIGVILDTDREWSSLRALSWHKVHGEAILVAVIAGAMSLGIPVSGSSGFINSDKSIRNSTNAAYGRLRQVAGRVFRVRVLVPKSISAAYGRLRQVAGRVLRVRVLVPTLVGVAFGLTFSYPMPEPLAGWSQREPACCALGVIVIGLVPYAIWNWHTADTRRRPLLLVVDNLDRCSADRVVRILETIHILLREGTAQRFLAVSWRAPADLVVLVLADGRWLRTAFEEVYRPFVRLGSDVNDLGSDFLHKIFDHTILIPSLSTSQVEGYVPTATGRHVDRKFNERTYVPSEDVRNTVEAWYADRCDLRDPKIDAQIQDPYLSREDRIYLEAARAELEATAAEVRLLEEHLLEGYAEYLPANPRLVKRVANAMGMLLALKSHLGHVEGSDTIARAAITYVRFPRLIEELLSDSPSLPPGVNGDDDTHRANGADVSPWLRSDVLSVLGGVSIKRLARCFGREY